MGINFVPTASLLAEGYSVALDQILISSEVLFSDFSAPPVLDPVSASSAHHTVLRKHFPTPFPYQTTKADLFARTRLAGISHIHSR